LGRAGIEVQYGDFTLEPEGRFRGRESADGEGDHLPRETTNIRFNQEHRIAAII
jgi:hypothetical protein